MTAYENNLIAKLLEDRASICSRNAYLCREELNAHATGFYWEEQYQIAAALAVRFREAGKLTNEQVSQ